MNLHTSTMTSLLGGFTQPNRLQIFSGTMPIMNADFAFAVSNYSAQALIDPLTVTVAAGNGSAYVSSTITPPPAVATAQATWFCLYNATTPATCIIGTVGTSAAGTAPLMLSTTALVAGNLVNITQVSFKLA